MCDNEWMNSPDKTPQVGILINTRLGWGRDVVKGILSYAYEAGPWNILIKNNTPRIFSRIPEEWNSDGLLAAVQAPELAEELDALGVPAVNVSDSPPAGFSGPTVRADDVAGTQMAVNHFLERGFRNIALVARSGRSVWEFYADAFKQAVTEQGLTCHHFTDPLSERGDEEIIQWLRDLPKPVGILALGPEGAARVVDCCRAVGIMVPHDVAVLSSRFDDILSRTCFPPLSGLLAPVEQIGYQAAAKLHRMMQGESVPHEITYIPPLGIRECLSTDTLAVDDPQLIQVIEFMREHAFEPITMHDVLKAVPMGRRTLERRFIKAFKRTPADEIRRLRINKARELLAATNMPMSHIAEACGYASGNYLMHAFKSATGTTLTAYRKQFR